MSGTEIAHGASLFSSAWTPILKNSRTGTIPGYCLGLRYGLGLRYAFGRWYWLGLRFHLVLANKV
eukprot:2304177-Rhodomonas_salina.1